MRTCEGLEMIFGCYPMGLSLVSQLPPLKEGASCLVFGPHPIQGAAVHDPCHGELRG